MKPTRRSAPAALLSMHGSSPRENVGPGGWTSAFASDVCRRETHGGRDASAKSDAVR
jgi:hypothetical protein